jgi:adenine phosphoribosyltransferase
LQPKSPSVNLRDHIRSIPDFPKPGILFWDITPLLAHPPAYCQAVCQLAEYAREKQADVVAAAEARGFLFAAPIAAALAKSLVPIRKRGKLPFKTISYSYDLEYGTDTLQIHEDAIPSGSRVLLVDDLLATGGTIDACGRLVEKAGGTVVGCAFLIELAGLGGAEKLARYDVSSLLKY